MDRIQEIKMNLKKLAVYLLVVLLLVNIAIFALKLISAFAFWAVIIIIGAVAYKDTIKRWIKA